MTRSRAVSLFVVALALFAVYAGTFTLRRTSDAHINRLQTAALVHHGDTDLTRYHPNLPAAVERDGRTTSIYGIGISIVVLPVFAPLSLLGANETTLHGVVSITFAAAAAAMMLALLLRVVPRAVAVSGTVLFALGTTMWPVASTALWAHAPVALLSALGLWAAASDRERAPMGAGLALASAAFVRPGAGALVIAVGLAMLLRGQRASAWFALGAIGPLVAIAIQNSVLWGGWFETGYPLVDDRFNHPLAEGLGQLVLGWRRGLLVYTPALVFAVPGIVWAIRRRTERHAQVVLAAGSASLATLITYGAWSSWFGGHNQFGYRLQLDALPGLVLVAAAGAASVPRLRAAWNVLVAASVATMAVGTLPTTDAWDGIHFSTAFDRSPFARAWTAVPDRFGSALARFGTALGGVWLIAVMAPQAVVETRARGRETNASP